MLLPCWKSSMLIRFALGDATRGTANAYKARIALYNKKWEVAAEAAEAVISSEIYKLYPKYGDLFLVSGLTDANNKEIIFESGI